MMTVNYKVRYVVDESGNRVSVLIGIEVYQSMLTELEELASIYAYEEAKSANDETILFNVAIREIEAGRRFSTDPDLGRLSN